MKFLIFLGLIAAATAGESNLLQQSNEQFTASLFQEIVKANPDKSVVLSAFSVMPPLAQLALASEDETHDELLKVIGLPNDNVTKEVFSSVTSKLKSVKGVDLKMANRIYIAQDAELNPAFESVSRAVFDSDVKNVNFGDNLNTATEINTWVEDQTNKRIKDLVDPNSLDSTTRALLVNAIYFKGTWKTQFDKALTFDKDFHVSKDKVVKVPTMTKTATFRYGESAALDAKLLELPYEGEESSLLIVLPNKIDGLKSLTEKLRDSSALNKAMQRMSSAEVDVSIPKFKIETTTNLKEMLKKMHVEKVFSPEAKLSKLLNKESNLFISEAIQKAFIEINEEGAEAAAANELNGLALAYMPTIHLYVDRPFYFQLENKGLSLFEGTFVEP